MKKRYLFIFFSILIIIITLSIYGQKKHSSNTIYESGGIICASLSPIDFSNKAKHSLSSIREKDNSFDGEEYKYDETNFFSKYYDSLPSLKNDIDINIADYSSNNGYLMEVNAPISQAIIHYSKNEIDGFEYTITAYIYSEKGINKNKWIYNSSKLGDHPNEVYVSTNQKYYIGESETVYVLKESNIVYCMILNGTDSKTIKKASKIFWG